MNLKQHKNNSVVNDRWQQPEKIEDEESLIRKSQADPEAFRLLYEKYFKKIFLFVLHRIGDKSITADITSQIFLKAAKNSPLK